jgi:hypothetical protein
MFVIDGGPPSIACSATASSFPSAARPALVGSILLASRFPRPGGWRSSERSR